MVGGMRVGMRLGQGNGLSWAEEIFAWKQSVGPRLPLVRGRVSAAGSRGHNLAPGTAGTRADHPTTPRRARTLTSPHEMRY